MFRFRTLLLIIIAIFALLMGALLAVPVYKKNFSAVEINGAKLLVEVAADPDSRARGLADRKSIPSNAGMLFLFNEPGRYGIWMKGMEFPIDIFWIKNGDVVDLEENLLPPEPGISDDKLVVYQPDIYADSVLETNAGFARKHGVKIGDSVKIFFGKKYLAQITDALSPDIKEVSKKEEYFIENLRKNPSAASNFKIEKLLSRNSVYRKYLISYRSDGLNLSGVMNVPSGKTPEHGFPLLILNHGLIHPDIYFSGRGSKREQDFFARHGYITIHPDYRGYGEIDPKLVCAPTLSFTSEGCHHDFYTGYTQDVIGLIGALKERKPGFIDLSRMGMWGHSMGGGIATRVMVLSPDIRAYVLFAPISADAEDNFYELKKEETDWLRKTYGEAGEEIYKKISPLTYFSAVQAPVQIHHGTSDKDVPIEFSEKIFDTLKAYGKKVEFFKYPDEAHEFGDGWPMAAERALQFFDKYVKGAR